MLRWYQARLLQRPLLTQSIGSSVLFGAGDVLAQQAVDRVGLEKHDFARTGRMMLYGGAIFGPGATTWYRFLQRNVVFQSTKSTLVARAVNFTFVPLEHRVLVSQSSSTTLPPNMATTENGVTPESAPNKENVNPEEPQTKEQDITVFHNPNNFNVKHPLLNEWVLWYTKPPSGRGDNWNDLLKEVVSFNSVEEFWGIYNNIAPASQLPLKADYHLFKKGVKPEWEDQQNKHGGRWSYSFKSKEKVPIDEIWLHAQLSVIGETLENDGDDELMGVVVNVRKAFYRLGLWTRTVGKPIQGGRNAEEGERILLGIGKRFKEALRLKDNEVLEFMGHTESAHAGSTRARPKLSV
ncbi:eukaryotic translation initiation factor 4E [Myotisia sp. PD_48]|nr:eukaryotic translation initiation factor 4E [Myotisia sp. PD_48]